MVDYDYILILGMEVVDGRVFFRDFLLDLSVVILNEFVVVIYGLDELLG